MPSFTQAGIYRYCATVNDPNYFGSNCPSAPGVMTIAATPMVISSGSARLFLNWQAYAGVDSLNASCVSSNGGLTGSLNGIAATAANATIMGLTNGKLYTCTVTPVYGGVPYAALAATGTGTPKGLGL
jgi:hypothetical protein